MADALVHGSVRPRNVRAFLSPVLTLSRLREAIAWLEANNVPEAAALFIEGRTLRAHWWEAERG